MVRNGKANFVLSTLCLLIAALFAYDQRQLSGVIKIDGSSTVYLLTEAVAGDFQRLNPRVRVTCWHLRDWWRFQKVFARRS
jgi:ABC-type phosphate transport system substrate-binding protein